jgi:hypothetical protein
MGHTEHMSIEEMPDEGSRPADQSAAPAPASAWAEEATMAMPAIDLFADDPEDDA